jgi:hypothetical protein
MARGIQYQIARPYLVRLLLLQELIQNPSQQLEAEEHHLEIDAT